MGPFAVAALLAAACVLLHVGASRGCRVPGAGHDLRAAIASSARRGRSNERGQDSVATLVQKLAALLQAGRPPALLWSDLLRAATSPGPASPPQGSAQVIRGAALAAAAGQPVPAAIRRTVRDTFPDDPEHSRQWNDVAACIEVAEGSGAPLAQILDRYAAHLEAARDAEAMRRTALAGPKATVRLLTWLPGFGLVLGILLGLDPLRVLLGTVAGGITLCAGIGLMALGRWWSRTLLRSATHSPNGRR